MTKDSDGAPAFFVSDVQLRFVGDGKDGLLAWVACVISGGVRVDNIAIRRGRDGGLLLTYPAKLTAAGTRHYLFNPISAEAAGVFEAAIFGKVRELLGPGAALPARGVEHT